MFGHLALIFLAFIGVDTSHTVYDIEGQGSLCGTAHLSGSTGADFSTEPYLWERCVLSPFSETDFEQQEEWWQRWEQGRTLDTDAELEAFVLGVFDGYRPWIRDRVAERFNGFYPWPRPAVWYGSDPDEPVKIEGIQGWHYAYLADDWEPKNLAVDFYSSMGEYCVAVNMDCSDGRSFAGTSSGGPLLEGVPIADLGEGTWRLPDTSALSYRSWRYELREWPQAMARISIIGTRSRYAALHELAHFIDGYTNSMPLGLAMPFHGDGLDYENALRAEHQRRRVHEGAGGHFEMSFRCLLLDLYYAHTGLIADEVYEPLHAYCVTHHANYARPLASSLSMGQRDPRGESMNSEAELPPEAFTDCIGEIPIVVASDVSAQPDVYAAALLAAALGSDCIVPSGVRDEPMPAAQLARLASAAPGGYIVGGEAAVPPAKVAQRVGMRRIGGADRWATIELIGRAIAQALDGSGSP